MKKVFWIGALLLFCAAWSWTDAADNFQAGGMEFGGELHIDYMPDAYISDKDSRDAEDGDYTLQVDGTATIGFFLIDRFSLQVLPGFFYWRERFGESGGDDIDNGLWISLGAGCDYYLLARSSLAFSLGLDFLITLVPGIDGKSGGVDDPDDSLAFIFHVEPNFTVYYFLTEHLAPYVSLCPAFFNYMPVKNPDGSDWDYPVDKGFFDYWQLDLEFHAGIKYFLPARSRFLKGRQKNFIDVIEGL